MVEVHLHAVLAHFENDTGDHSSHAVHHRDGVSRHEKILAYLTVHLECSLWQVDDPAWIHFPVSVGRGEGHIKTVSRLHSFDMCLKLRQKAAGSVYIVKRLFLCSVVDHLSVHFEFVAEFHYLVLFNFHMSSVLILS